MNSILKVIKLVGSIDLRLFAASVGVVFMIFYQSYVDEPILEMETESSLQVKIDKEGGKGFPFRVLMEDEVLELHVIEDYVVSYSCLDLFFEIGKLPSFIAYKLEIPIPPPEFHFSQIV